MVLPAQPGWPMIGGNRENLLMRKMLLAAACAACLGAQAAKAEEIVVQLSPSDPKFKSAECVSMRAKARNYQDGILQQSAGSYVFAAVMPGGTVGFLAMQHRKREMFKRQVEVACTTNPPKSYLDPSATIGK
jgi:hypothetical protein